MANWKIGKPPDKPKGGETQPLNGSQSANLVSKGANQIGITMADNTTTSKKPTGWFDGNPSSTQIEAALRERIDKLPKL